MAMAEKVFESWLWEEARATAKHCHSDSGVFTAAWFKEACDEDGQTQNFSGAEAQHQSPEAERSIQTVVCTPLEFVAKDKANDADLAMTHVWGCPCCVLNAKLQSNHKLPKLSKRARRGHFLGFSRFHSCTVALARDLHTGHTSHQCHAAFDDKFEAIFSNGKSGEEADKTCEKLLAGNKECCVEEEFDERGVIVCEPPPLDEVWLSEPEQRNREIALDRQRRIAERTQKDLAEKQRIIPIKKSNPCPDLVGSDVESGDGDSQCGEDASFESGGEVQSDKDLWADHPSHQSTDQPANTVSAPEEAPVSVPEEATGDGLGRGPEGNARRDRGPNMDYKMHMGEKQIPPGVRRMSVQRIRHSKRK